MLVRYAVTILSGLVHTFCPVLAGSVLYVRTTINLFSASGNASIPNSLHVADIMNTFKLRVSSIKGG